MATLFGFLLSSFFPFSFPSLIDPQSGAFPMDDPNGRQTFVVLVYTGSGFYLNPDVT
jgi:hypothetical protein